MVAEPPLNRLVLTASSVADDLTYVALADLSHVLGDGPNAGYRIIGGHMVTALAARWRLGRELYRETADTDLGVPPLVLRESDLITRLKAHGYHKVEGDRFARTVEDVPVDVDGTTGVAREAVIDVLVPAYTSRPRTNRRIGDLVTTEVPGLATALQREPVRMGVELCRLNGEILRGDLCFPDEAAALVLKGFAVGARNKATDIVDVWRCLEVAFAAGIRRGNLGSNEAAEAAILLRALFDERDGPGFTALARQQHLSTEAADARFTRLRALVAQVLGSR